MSLEEAMMELGWEYFQSGPDKGEWLMFDRNDEIIAREGSERWLRDYKEAMLKIESEQITRERT